MKKFHGMKKIIFLALVSAFLISSVGVYAQTSSDSYNQEKFQNRQSFKFTSPEEVSINSFDNLESVVVDENENAGDKEFDVDALKSRIIQKEAKPSKQANSSVTLAEAYEPDSYEPNNDFDQAFPYSSTEKMTGNSFVEGYVSAGIHDENDVDVFSINLNAGTDYFFSLKNLCHDYDLAVFSPDRSSYWANMQYETTAESFYMNAPTSGTYYIVIFGNGMPEYLNYFFKAVKAIQTKNVTIPSGLTFNFNGAGTTPYLSFDTRNIIPSDAVLNSVYIDSNGNGYWVGLTKYLRASDGTVYSNQDRTGLDYINYPANTQYASQLWGIAGKVYEPTTYFSWKPNVSMEYTYVEVE